MNFPRPRILPREIPRTAAYTRRQKATQSLTIGAFLLPGTIIYLLFLIWPIIQAVHFSRFDWNGLGLPTKLYDNYGEILNDPVFREAVGHTLVILTLSLVVQLPLALFLATVVGRKLRGRAIFRIIFFLPYVFSEIVTATIFSFVFTGANSLMNTILRTVIPGYTPVAWLGRGLVLISIFVVLTWKYFGLYMILYMAALQQVSADLEDAARIDGAREWQVLRYVTYPMMGTTIRLTIYLSVVGSLNVFVLVWVLTAGGPYNASHLMATYMYWFGPLSNRLGFGAAAAVILFVVAFVFSVLYQRFVMRQDYQGDVS